MNFVDEQDPDAVVNVENLVLLIAKQKEQHIKKEDAIQLLL